MLIQRKLATEFKMKDLGMMHYFLGMEVSQNVDGISLEQWKHAVEILKRFGMMDYKVMAKPMASNLKLLSDTSSETVDATMYRQMICSLVFLMNMRPEICFAMNNLSQFLTDSRHAHLVAKHAVRYLKGTIEYGLKHDMNQKTNLHGYVDLDWVGSTTKRKRTLGFFFSLISSMGYWFGRMRSCMVLSTIERGTVNL